MKDFFLKDSVLKVISFVVAILLWVYIITVVDPAVTMTVRNIPIRYINQNVLEEKGLCLISDSKTKVELKIKGSRKKIANIENKNIYATVDLTTVGKTGTFSLPIAISIPYEYDEIVSKKPYNASVVVDKIISVYKDVRVLTKGSVANGYIAGEAVPEVKSVKLTGASTVINDISSAGVELNFDDRSAAINEELKVFFVDREKNRVPADDSMYSLISVDTESVMVQCPIYKLKTVPVEVDARSGGDVSQYRKSVQPSNVTIYAENEVLEQIEAIKTEPINLDTMEQNAQEVKLVIPEGVRMRDGITEVTVKAEKKD